MIKVTSESGEPSKNKNIPDKYYPLEKYLRDLPVAQEEVTLTFERIEQVLNDPLPAQAREPGPWWGNQKRGIHVETNAWMDAGWMVETVDLNEKWVRFVRQ
jgi:hypothetical protein